jgi:4-hydroxysphinganine ceramide fatty acyl 2-hydroxylase
MPGSVRLFGPWYLEMFTKTTWFTVPLIWLPIAGYILRQSVAQQLASGVGLTTALSRSGACFLFGNFVWTVRLALPSISSPPGGLTRDPPYHVQILEYTLHRFLFHIDHYLPDRPFFLMLHFLLHGIHHYVPASRLSPFLPEASIPPDLSLLSQMDRMRLVMPPLLFTALQAPFTKLAHSIFPNWMANGIIAGAFTFYVLYDVMHYALHHTKLPEVRCAVFIPSFPPAPP